MHLPDTPLPDERSFPPALSPHLFPIDFTDLLCASRTVQSDTRSLPSSATWCNRASLSLSGKWGLPGLCEYALPVLSDGLQLPISSLNRAATGIFTAITCRLALYLMGYWWIETEMASPKRGSDYRVNGQLHANDI